MNKNYYPQVFLEECRYIIKKQQKQDINDDFEIFYLMISRKKMVMKKVIKLVKRLSFKVSSVDYSIELLHLSTYGNGKMVMNSSAKYYQQKNAAKKPCSKYQNTSEKGKKKATMSLQTT